MSALEQRFQRPRAVLLQGLVRILQHRDQHQRRPRIADVLELLDRAQLAESVERRTVRERAAMTLAALRVAEAAEPLRAAYEALKARGTRLDWSEASGIRWALTELGLRTPVVPPFVAERAQHVDPIGTAWPVGDLVEVIEELASARQLITFVSAYTRNAGSYGWRVDVDVEWPELDARVPWTQLVAAARDAAMDVATHPRVPNDAYATISWIDRSDA